mmetsp:Transcript_21402/g.55632  ORF Transcript_21402/g.55632 Transcript_21402/m.55632 type:complete len:212 (-) Transcript_21402:309-944(-)
MMLSSSISSPPFSSFSSFLSFSGSSAAFGSKSSPSPSSESLSSPSPTLGGSIGSPPSSLALSEVYTLRKNGPCCPALCVVGMIIKGPFSGCRRIETDRDSSLSGRNGRPFPTISSLLNFPLLASNEDFVTTKKAIGWSYLFQSSPVFSILASRCDSTTKPTHGRSMLSVNIGFFVHVGKAGQPPAVGPFHSDFTQCTSQLSGKSLHTYRVL